MAGVAPGANIIAMQVFTRFNGADVCGTGQAPCVASYQSDQMAALDELAALDSAHPSWNIVAANLSLGGGSNTVACDTDARKQGVDTLLAQGVATVIAAGNDGFGAKVSTPGCISSAVTVGATNDSDTVASYSNRGALLDVFAPGSSITSSVPDDGWATYNGTSMATPHVVGALALMRQHTPAARSPRSWRTSRPAERPSPTGPAGSPSPPAGSTSRPHSPPTAHRAWPSRPRRRAPEGSALTVSGTWGDADGDAVTVTASTGTLTKGVGTWTWTAARGDDTSLPVIITATDAVTAPAPSLHRPLGERGADRDPAGCRHDLERRTAHDGRGPTTVSVNVTDPGSRRHLDGVELRRRHPDLHPVPPPPPDGRPGGQPAVEPRAFTRTVSHTYTQACTRTVPCAPAMTTVACHRTAAVPWSCSARAPRAGPSPGGPPSTAASPRTSGRPIAPACCRAPLSTVFVEKRALTTTADAVAVPAPRLTHDREVPPRCSAAPGLARRRHRRGRPRRPARQRPERLR